MKKQVHSSNLKIIGIIVAVIVIAAAGYMIFSRDRGTPQQEVALPKIVINQPETDASKPLISDGKLRINDHFLSTGTGEELMVRGTAENIGVRTLSYAEVIISFRDANGNLIIKMSDKKSDLDVGEKWDFRVVYPTYDKERVSSYSIEIGNTIYGSQ